MENRKTDGNMDTHCLECGALRTSDDGCAQRFHHFLALEMTDPEYGAVHHLTVPAYMLQHPSQLSRVGWQAIYDLLAQFLSNENFTPALARARNRKAVDNKNRTWSFIKGERLVLPTGFRWSQTILNIDDASPVQYCMDIQEWARLVLDEAAMIREQI
jgi:hypothetical protein